MPVTIILGKLKQEDHCPRHSKTLSQKNKRRVGVMAHRIKVLTAISRELSSRLPGSTW